tara:strand:- start:4680 stop:4898 length:219 start_codon:yes stop_codon:yes gene_type:complete
MIYTVAAVLNLIVFVLLGGVILLEYGTTGRVTSSQKGGEDFTPSEIVGGLVFSAAGILTSVQVLFNAGGTHL